MSWHVEPELLEAYAGGTIDQASAFSIEAHVLACESCRERVAGLVDQDRLARVWDEVQERVDAPRRGPVEALLVRVGTPDHLARLLAATPSLTLSWFGAVAISLAFAVAAAHHGERGVLLFLALAPLLPLGGVAVAYGAALDPTYEIALASPIRSFRLLLIRAVAVLATTTALIGAAALALPDLDWAAPAWLLPALALTLLSLALTTFISPVAAFGSVAFAWLTVVTVSGTVADETLVAFRGAAQIVFLILTVAGALVVAQRRDSFDFGRSM